MKKLEAVPADVLRNSCFLKFRNIHRETPVLESLFNKVAVLKAYSPATLLKGHSNTGVFLWILRHFLRTAFFYRTPPVNASEEIHDALSYYKEFLKLLRLIKNGRENYVWFSTSDAFAFIRLYHV